jgi:hypothetical protein
MKFVPMIVMLLVLGFGTRAFSQEHPEHPKNAEPPKSAEMISVDVLADAITQYITDDAKLKGGFFLVYDAVDKKPLVLQLDKVHRDKLAVLGGGVYFACTDMKAQDGTMYDLDFFMKQSGKDLKTTEVAVHKKAGVPRYNWKEEDGVWKKVGA